MVRELFPVRKLWPWERALPISPRLDELLATLEPSTTGAVFAERVRSADLPESCERESCYPDLRAEVFAVRDHLRAKGSCPYDGLLVNVFVDEKSSHREHRGTLAIFPSLASNIPSYRSSDSLTVTESPVWRDLTDLCNQSVAGVDGQRWLVFIEKIDGHHDQIHPLFALSSHHRVLGGPLGSDMGDENLGARGISGWDAIVAAPALQAWDNQGQIWLFARPQWSEEDGGTFSRGQLRWDQSSLNYRMEYRSLEATFPAWNSFPPKDWFEEKPVRLTLFGHVSPEQDLEVFVLRSGAGGADFLPAVTVWRGPVASAVDTEFDLSRALASVYVRDPHELEQIGYYQVMLGLRVGDRIVILAVWDVGGGLGGGKGIVLPL